MARSASALLPLGSCFPKHQATMSIYPSLLLPGWVASAKKVTYTILSRYHNSKLKKSTRRVLLSARRLLTLIPERHLFGGLEERCLTLQTGLQRISYQATAPLVGERGGVYITQHQWHNNKQCLRNWLMFGQYCELLFDQLNNAQQPRENNHFDTVLSIIQSILSRVLRCNTIDNAPSLQFVQLDDNNSKDFQNMDETEQ